MAGFNKVISGSRFGPSGLSVIERFWANVDKSDESSCWLWKGPLNNKGYGMFNVKWEGADTSKWKSFLAHRFSWLLERGPIIDDICILHHCDTPPCINPWHLFDGTQADNALDKVSKGRQRSGETVPNGKLTLEQARQIKTMLASEVKQKDIASALGVNLWLVKDISRGKTWNCLQ